MKLWTPIKSALINLLNAEKSYAFVQYLSQKNVNKDKYYETSELALRQIHKECNQVNKIQNKILEITDFLEFITQLLQFIDFRMKMATL